VTILDGVTRIAGANIAVTYAPGCPLALRRNESNDQVKKTIAAAVTVASGADVVIYVGGISPDFEGEEFGGNSPYDGFSGGDRSRIELPPVQESMLNALQGTGKPVVFVNCSGSAIAMPWEAEQLPAILQAWYPGEQGGRAVAEALFGDVNPSGRLPVTFYRSTEDLPDFDDYSMSNRTYRYFNGQALFAFGHGLSYTAFDYQNPRLDPALAKTGQTVRLTFTLTNTGKFDGDEVAQVYFRHKHSAVVQPKMALCGFERVHLAKGKVKSVTVEIPVQRLRYWDVNTKKYQVEGGDYEFLVGGASDDIRLEVPLKISGDKNHAKLDTRGPSPASQL
jgi:beta-glucosidase